MIGLWPTEVKDAIPHTSTQLQSKALDHGDVRPRVYDGARRRLPGEEDGTGKTAAAGRHGGTRRRRRICVEEKIRLGFFFEG